MYTQNTDLQASDIAADTTDDVTADSSDDGAANTNGGAANISSFAADVTDIPEAPAHADVTDVAEIEEAADAAESDVVAETADTPNPPAIRILCIKDCASLSGRSTLTYHIGCSVASTVSDSASSALPEPHLRIFANTAMGYFCKDWISLALLDLLLSETKSFASSTVQRMFFAGKSINSGGFVLAALRNEGLVRAIPGSLRSYERLDPTVWQQEIAALIEAGVSLAENGKPVVAKEVAATGASIAATAASVSAKSAKPRSAPVASKTPVATKARSPKKASKS